VDTVILDAGQAAAPPADGDPPYKGLDFYDVADAPLFFGRERLTAELVAFVRQHSFLAIVGASGSGKSSLARAGLIASLLGQNARPLEDSVQPPLGSRDWRYVAVTPTAHPFEALARGLAGEGAEAVALLNALRADPLALRERVPALAGHGGHLLLLVDQFEELFTLCKEKVERDDYVKALLAACGAPDFAATGASCTVILTVRADFYAQCIGFENLRAALEKHQKPIGAMTPAELQRTIELPAHAGRWAFQQGLGEQILHDVGDQPGKLPLLSYALLETWKRRSGRVMTLAGYQAAGGVDKAISQTAERVYKELNKQGLGDVARRIFLSLVEPGDQGRATRRREPLAALMTEDSQSPKAKALQALSAKDARLVTVDGEVVQISHEALIGAWPKLAEWLTTYRDDLRLLDGIRDAAAAWRAAKEEQREDQLAHRGGRLEDALKLRDAGEYALGQPERAYLAACVALRDRERAAERRRQRDRFRLIAGAAVVALALALLAGVFGIQSRNNANIAATREAEAQAASTRAVAQQKTAEANASEAKRQEGIAADNAQKAKEAQATAETSAKLAQAQLDRQKGLALLQEAYKLKEQGDVQGATEKLQAAKANAQATDTDLGIDVEAEIADVRRQVATKLVQEGETLAKSRDLPAAEAKFKAALALDPPSDTPVYIFIPAGAFVMGSGGGHPNERPTHEIPLDAYWMQRTEVTNAQYGRCVEAKSCGPPDDGNVRYQDTQYAEQPVTGVTFSQASTYAAWVGGRLPTEAEWEKACRGGLEIPREPLIGWGQMKGNDQAERPYPWGNKLPSEGLLNFDGAGLGMSSAVGSYPGGASPYGALDMAGNVWEWTSSTYTSYPYNPMDGRESTAGETYVLRGGSFDASAFDVRCTIRREQLPFVKSNHSGFRVVVSPGS
jgi:formylglycine-generating enzyme required for sulfatase activity